jgi:hypothetical protein
MGQKRHHQSQFNGSCISDEISISNQLELPDNTTKLLIEERLLSFTRQKVFHFSTRKVEVSHGAALVGSCDPVHNSNFSRGDPGKIECGRAAPAWCLAHHVLVGGARADRRDCHYDMDVF